MRIDSDLLDSDLYAITAQEERRIIANSCFLEKVFHKIPPCLTKINVQKEKYFALICTFSNKVSTLLLGNDAQEGYYC